MIREDLFAATEKKCLLCLLIFLTGLRLFFGADPAIAVDAIPFDSVDTMRAETPTFNLSLMTPSEQRDTSSPASDQEVRPEPVEHRERLLSIEYGKRIGQDTAFILTAPARWDRRDWTIFSLEAATAGGAFLLDRSVQERVQKNRTKTTDRIARIFEPFGAEYSAVVLGGFYLAGVGLGAPKAEAVAMDGLAATLVASAIITPTIKIVAGRDRPAQSEGVYDFHPFRFLGDNSFPSGHTTQAFAVASVIATHSDPIWVKGTAYTIAALVGYARIEHNAHFFSDVTAGALIGASVGSAIVHFNEKQRGALSMVPMIEPDRRGLALTVRF